ncbi:unnamed protein product [Lactuca saligna]|uniref:Uncharacterized protein n=1 Tax=Lactuca saligna TaxID=75948 RepID=A0AA36E6G0_LACSI|nr:unnamed protein product [Lactuca saligna]
MSICDMSSSLFTAYRQHCSLVVPIVVDLSLPLHNCLSKYCDSKIDEIELVVQILRQLPPSYHIIINVLTNTNPFPSFHEAKNMLHLHESHEESTEATNDAILTSSAALFSSAPNK